MTTNFQAGHDAEKQVAKYLEKQGFKILELNWRTRWCEVDIIAKKNGVVHFVEVKFRSREDQGSGFDYITRKKLNQMRFAAEFWISNKEYDGEAVLSVAQVGSGQVIDFVENIS